MAGEQRSIKERASEIPSMLTVRNFYRLFAFVLLISGACFYVGWSIAYDTWTDIGLTSYCVPLVIFGILLLMLDQEKQAQAEKSRQ